MWRCLVMLQLFLKPFNSALLGWSWGEPAINCCSHTFVGETGFSTLAGMIAEEDFSGFKPSWRTRGPDITQRAYWIRLFASPSKRRIHQKAWSWRCCAGATTTWNTSRCPVMQRGVCALLFLLRRSWGRMGTAWRTALHLLLHAAAPSPSRTRGDPNPRSPTSLSSPWLSGTPPPDVWLWRK